MPGIVSLLLAPLLLLLPATVQARPVLVTPLEAAQFGRISIANSDAAATPLTQAAIDQGHRAAQEVLRVRMTSTAPRA